MEKPYSRHLDEASRFIRLAAICLYVLFAGSILSVIVPIRLIDPSWQLNGINSLQNVAFLPLIGTCLLILASEADGTSTRQRLGWIRKACAAVCIGFLLLIPLQASAMWRLGILMEIPANRTIATIASARSEIASSRDLSELNNALTKLPGAPKLPPGFNQPLAQVRQSMEQKLTTDLEKLRSSQRQRIADRRLPEVLLFSRTVLVNLVFAVFFGAVAGFQLPQLRALPQLANPFSLVSENLENWERRRSAKRRAFEASGQNGSMAGIVKAFNKQLKHMQRRGEARRLAARSESTRRSRRG